MLPDNLIGAWLAGAGIETDACAVREAMSAIDASLDPLQQVGGVIRALRLTGVQPEQAGWHRLDPRRLPGLVPSASGWCLVSRDQQGQVLLRDASGDTRAAEPGELDHQAVICLRVAARRAPDQPFSFRDNIAARLVLAELFRTRGWLRDIAIATVIINLLAIATSLFAMQVYDRVVPTLAYATLWTLVGIMLIVTVLDWGLKTLRARILDSLASAVDKRVSQQVFDHLLALQLDARPRSLGTLAAQVGGLDAVRQFFTSGIVFGLVDLPFALMFIGFIAMIGGPIAGVYLLLLPVAAALGIVARKRMRRLLREQMIRSNERQGMLVDVIQGAETVQSQHADWRFSQEWSDISATIARYNIQQKAINNRASVTTGALSSLAYVAAVVVGVGQIASGELSMGALIACSILGGKVIAPIAQGVQHLVQWQNIVQSLQLVNQVLMLPARRRPEQALLAPEREPDRVGLEQLSFVYPESMVKQLSVPALSLSAGERIALLGNVGSGKSTLLKLIAGLYRPTEGRVRIGDADLWELDPQVLADVVGYLPQSVDLFKGTLRSNLCLAGLVGDSHLLSVCEDLGIDRIAANSPLGMDLPISEGGTGLSGGQRQLVGLGRVLLGQPRIWLLDEPTASLDNETEMRVLNAVRDRLRADDILVVSTHKPAIAQRLCNRTIVMAAGGIVDDGPTAAVLARRAAAVSGGMPSGTPSRAANGARAAWQPPRLGGIGHAV